MHHSQSFAGQLARQLHPGNELRFVKLTLMDVEIAYFIVLGLAWRDRAQRCAAEECHFDVFGEAMKAEEPAALILDAIERRIPFHGLARAGDGAGDEGVEVAP